MGGVLHEDDVIIVTSLLLTTESFSVVSNLLIVQVFFHNSLSVKQCCKLRENWKSSTSRPVQTSSISLSFFSILSAFI